MKNQIVFLILSICLSAFAQDTLPISKIKLKSQIFSLSPISKKVEKVNGIVFGIGHFENRNIQNQTVNGLNLEANPTGLLFPIVLLSSMDKRFKLDNLVNDFDTSKTIKVNGLNISTGGFSSNAVMNGINISTITAMHKMNGFSISAFIVASQRTNGLSIAGFYNGNYRTVGAQIAMMNYCNDLKGAQIGLYNNCAQSMTGIQIGLLNISEKTRGLQIGLLNINKKKALPFINF